MRYPFAERHAEAIASMREEAVWTQDGPNRALLLDADRRRRNPLWAFYAPFDYVNRDARLLILGITPGKTQMIAAILEMRRRLLAGDGLEEALRAAKVHGSFSGKMRPRLVEMLDRFRINEYLGIASCASLWGADSHLAQFCSGLRYPIFVGEDFRNYTGQNPKPLASGFLRRWLGPLADMVADVPDAIVVPLGAVMHEVCAQLAREGGIDARSLVVGIEHPSGGSNGNSGYLVDPKPRSAYSDNSSIPFSRIDENRARLERTMSRLIAAGRPTA